MIVYSAITTRVAVWSDGTDMAMITTTATGTLATAIGYDAWRAPGD